MWNKTAGDEKINEILTNTAKAGDKETYQILKNRKLSTWPVNNVSTAARSKTLGTETITKAGWHS